MRSARAAQAEPPPRKVGFMIALARLSRSCDADRGGGGRAARRGRGLVLQPGGRAEVLLVAVDNRRQQKPCTSCGVMVRSELPGPRTAESASRRTALRDAASHISHSAGLFGSRSASSKNPRQTDGTTTFLLLEKAQVDATERRGLRLRRLAQYSARDGLSTDAVPGTNWCRTILVQRCETPQLAAQRKQRPRSSTRCSLTR